MRLVSALITFILIGLMTQAVADEAGISRLYGGIHVPPDDFAGRIMGSSIGKEAFERAMQYYRGVPEPSTLVLVVMSLLVPLTRRSAATR